MAGAPVRQARQLPYHFWRRYTGKPRFAVPHFTKTLSNIFVNCEWRFSLVTLTKFGPCDGETLISIDQFQHVHDLHDLLRPNSYLLETVVLLTTKTSARHSCCVTSAKFMCYVLKFFLQGLKCNFKVVGKKNPWAPVKICGPLSNFQRPLYF